LENWKIFAQLENSERAQPTATVLDAKAYRAVAHPAERPAPRATMPAVSMSPPDRSDTDFWHCVAAPLASHLSPRRRGEIFSPHFPISHRHRHQPSASALQRNPTPGAVTDELLSRVPRVPRFPDPVWSSASSCTTARSHPNASQPPPLHPS
jgi:hypothetical protein